MSAQDSCAAVGCHGGDGAGMARGCGDSYMALRDRRLSSSLPP